VLLMIVAGLNMAAFYLTMYGRVMSAGPGEQAPWAARVAGGTSLACWIGVVVCGRYITFYRPPHYWCPWC
jgi:hypothetical protein